MLSYPQLNSRWRRMPSESVLRNIGEYLIGVWLDDYLEVVGSAPTNVVVVSNTGFS